MCVDPQVIVVKSALADARQASRSLPLPPKCNTAASEPTVLINQI